MSPEKWRQIEKIFHSVIMLAPAEREQYLVTACAEDKMLRSEVESLIEASEQAQEQRFLRSPIENRRPITRWADLTGLVLDEKYRIERQLGEGGMGAVYLAKHLGTGRPVALKVIAPQLMAHGEFVERFKREALAAGCLVHHNVVNVTDFGFAEVGSDRLAYLAMEYLNGCTLGALLKERGRLPLNLVVDIIEQVCSALDAAHRLGIIHRDIKPDNIWLQPNRSGGYNVKVLDFGLAKLRDNMNVPWPEKENALTVNNNSNTAITAVKTEGSSEQVGLANYLSYAGETIEMPEPGLRLRPTTHADIDPITVPEWMTRVGTVLGTPLYMSPEQCHGQSLDTRSDIYSLGVVAYQMLAGKTPFSGDMYKLIEKHSEMPPPPLKDERRDIPKSVAALVMSALAKNQHERPASAAIFATALRAAAEGEVPLLRQAGMLYSKHFSPIYRASLLLHAPLIMLSFLFIDLPHQGIVPHAVIVWFDLIITFFLIHVFTIGACAAAVDQLRKAPSEPVKLSLILKSLYQRAAPLARTVYAGDFEILREGCKFVLPGIRRCIDYTLVAPVVMMEGIRGRDALARSSELSQRLSALTFSIQMRNLFMLVMSPFIFIFTIFLASILFEYGFYTSLSNLVIYSSVLIAIGVIALVQPIVGVSIALLYLKARHAGQEAETSETEGSSLADLPVFSYGSYRRTIAVMVAVVVMIGGWLAGKDALLRWAAVRGHSQMAAMLVSVGADTESRDLLFGATSLHLIAMESANENTARKLIRAGAQVDARDQNGLTPLMHASFLGMYGNYDVMQALLSAGASVKARSNRGVTPLHFSLVPVIGHDMRKVQLLITAGADLNARDHDGKSPLHYAARHNWGYYETVKTLIAAGADLNLRDKDGKTPLAYAKERNLHDMVELLQRAGATE